MVYRSFLSVAVVLLLAVSAAGQSTTGTITGTVSDVTGAVLPGVEVTVTNVGTNLTRNLITNESGNYTAPQLPFGSYRVEAVLPGFQTAVRSGITLNVDERARVDLVLEVGQVTEVVEVTAEAPLIQTEDSSIGTVIDHQKITELPLNGRNFESLVLLSPAAVTAHQGSHLAARGGIVVAGVDEHYQSFYIDGVDNVDTIIRNFTYRPSIDAIEEFKVQSTGYSAEFGRNAGAVINVTTRSGTNEFHGAIFDYHRNKALNTSTIFAEEAGLEKEGFLRNQFGATLGGPIIRDKTFFFVAYEGQRQRQQILKRARVPTLAMRSGDLSELGPVTDPLTGQPFPNNMIPRDRWAALSEEVLDGNFWPTPSQPGLGRNLVTGGNKTENFNNISIKIDHAFTDVHRMSGRYSYANEFIFNPYGSETNSGRNLPNFGQWNPRYRTSSGMNLTSVFSPTVINEVRVGFNRFAQPLADVYNSLASLVGEERLPLPPVMAAIPRNRDAFDEIRLSGQFENLSAGGGFHRLNNTWNIIDSLTINSGNHSFKMGFDFRKMDFHNITGSVNRYEFDGRFTGEAFGDYLLGLPFRTRTQVGIAAAGIPPREYGRERKRELALYFQDDWKVSQQLTVNWGLRWDYYDPLYALNGLSGWSQSDNKIHVVCQEAYADECGRGVIDPNLYVIQDGGNSTVPRGLTNPDKNNLGLRTGFAYSPPADSNTVIRAGYGIFYDSDDRHKSFCCVKNAPFNTTLNFGPVVTPDIDLDVTPFPESLSRAGAVTTGAYDPNQRDTYSQKWNLGVQHELAGSLMMDVSYVGSLTLKGRRNRRINQPFTPGPGSVGSRRPFLPFGNFASNGYFENSGSSNFHSLQTKLEQRFSSGLTFINSFMWGKAMDNRAVGTAGGSRNAFAQDHYNWNAEYGPSSFDVRLKYSFSYVYEFPGGNNAFTRGWQLAGIVTAQSGRPFTPDLGANVANVGNVSRPNRVCDGKLDNPTQDRWFDVSCFVTPDPFTYGSSGRAILEGDGFFNWDMSVMKNTYLVDERVNVQFRVEIFNLTDQSNFGFPETRVDRSSAGSIGTLLGNPTQVQLGLRIVY